MPARPAQSIALAVGGLAQATLIATYDYWGYYNICFLGSEVRRPERTIPRSILLSVLFVAVFYVAMNLAALPSHARCRYACSVQMPPSALQLVAHIARSAFGQWAGRLMAALIVWTAFASVFSLLLGYSRVPYAAARDGNYFDFLAAIHPKHGIPHRALIALGVVASVFCFFSLQEVITMLVITRILLQFLLQQAALSCCARSGRTWNVLSDAAVSAAAALRDRRFSLHSDQPDPRAERLSCRGRHRGVGNRCLSLSRRQTRPVAVHPPWWRRAGQRRQDEIAIAANKPAVSDRQINRLSP